VQASQMRRKAAKKPPGLALRKPEKLLLHGLYRLCRQLRRLGRKRLVNDENDAGIGIKRRDHLSRLFTWKKGAEKKKLAFPKVRFFRTHNCII